MGKNAKRDCFSSRSKTLLAAARFHDHSAESYSDPYNWSGGRRYWIRRHRQFAKVCRDAANDSGLLRQAQKGASK